MKKMLYIISKLFLLALVIAFVVLSYPFYVVVAFGKAICDMEGFGEFVDSSFKAAMSLANFVDYEYTIRNLSRDNKRLKSEINGLNEIIDYYKGNNKSSEEKAF